MFYGTIYDISKFSLEWLGVEVFQNKILIRTNDPSKFGPLKDLMISAFKILEHTPINQLGMNLTTLFKINTEESWHKIGDNLVPKSIWNESLPERVGLTSLTVQSPRPDSLNGKINVTVKSVRRDFFGVEFSVNSHVDLVSESKDEQDKYDGPTIVAEHWESALDLARKIGKDTISRSIET